MQNNYFKTIITLLFISAIFFLNGCEKEEIIETTSSEVNKGTIENSVKMVELSASQIEKTNITTMKVESSNSNLIISAPAIVSPAPDYFFVVSAPVDGRIVTLLAHEGEAVKKGQLILEIESS